MSPEMPRLPNRERMPLDSQMMLVLTVAPESTVLNGKMSTPWFMIAFSPTRQSSPRTAPSSMRTPDFTSQLRASTLPLT